LPESKSGRRIRTATRKIWGSAKIGEMVSGRDDCGGWNKPVMNSSDIRLVHSETEAFVLGTVLPGCPASAQVVAAGLFLPWGPSPSCNEAK
jgi:hypothetical protein